MFLAVDRDEHWDEQRADKQLELAMLRWRYRAPSVLLHHGKACCAIAREWTFATDYMQLNGENELTGPRWIRARYKWGPSKWPLSWCEAVEKKTLDCGALSAMTAAVFDARGITAYPAQLIQIYSDQSSQHWRANWDAEQADADWLWNGLTYHEACAVVIDRNILRIWDPSVGCWVDPPQLYGYGSVLAVRVVAGPAQLPAKLIWRTTEVQVNQWQKIKLAADSIPVWSSAEEQINETIALEKQMTAVESLRYESTAGGD